MRWRTPGGTPSNTVRRWRGSRWHGVRAMAAGISLFLVGAMILVVPATNSPAGATPAPISNCTNPSSTLTTGQTLSSGACLVYNPYLILQRWGTTASRKEDPENVVPAVTTVATLTNSTAGSYVISGVHETLTNNTFSLQDALEKFGWL